jgi:hypothetical protein
MVVVFLFGWVSFTVGGPSGAIGDRIYTNGGHVFLEKQLRSIWGDFIFLEGVDFLLLGVELDYWTNFLSGKTHLDRGGGLFFLQ